MDDLFEDLSPKLQSEKIERKNDDYKPIPNELMSPLEIRENAINNLVLNTLSFSKLNETERNQKFDEVVNTLSKNQDFLNSLSSEFPFLNNYSASEKETFFKDFAPDLIQYSMPSLETEKQGKIFDSAKYDVFQKFSKAIDSLDPNTKFMLDLPRVDKDSKTPSEIYSPTKLLDNAISPHNFSSFFYKSALTSRQTEDFISPYHIYTRTDDVPIEKQRERFLATLKEVSENPYFLDKITSNIGLNDRTIEEKSKYFYQNCTDLIADNINPNPLPPEGRWGNFRIKVSSYDKNRREIKEAFSDFFIPISHKNHLLELNPHCSEKLSQAFDKIDQMLISLPKDNTREIFTNVKNELFQNMEIDNVLQYREIIRAFSNYTVGMAKALDKRIAPVSFISMDEAIKEMSLMEQQPDKYLERIDKGINSPTDILSLSYIPDYPEVLERINKDEFYSKIMQSDYLKNVLSEFNPENEFLVQKFVSFFSKTDAFYHINLDLNNTALGRLYNNYRDLLPIQFGMLLDNLYLSNHSQDIFLAEKPETFLDFFRSIGKIPGLDKNNQLSLFAQTLSQSPAIVRNDCFNNMEMTLMRDVGVPEYAAEMLDTYLSAEIKKCPDKYQFSDFINEQNMSWTEENINELFSVLEYYKLSKAIEAFKEVNGQKEAKTTSNTTNGGVINYNVGFFM